MKQRVMNMEAYNAEVSGLIRSETTVHHERALVGLCLLDPSTIDSVEIDLGAYHWIDSACKTLWPVITEMRRNGEPVGDIRNVAVRVSSSLPTVEIAKIVNDAGMVGQDSYHVGFLNEITDRSRLRRIASELLRRVEDPNDNPEALRDWIASQGAVSVSARSRTKSATEHIREIVKQSTEPKSRKSIQTGIQVLDNVIGGFRPGQLIILAARPSVGKSALASQFAVDAAKGKHRVLFVSLEMTALETVARILAMELNFDTQTVLNGELASHQVIAALSLADSYQSIPLLIEDRRGMNIERLSSIIRSSAAEEKLDLVVIDYLGLIVGDRRKPRWESFSEISNQLKTLAQTEKIPILALCQLNRESEGETPKLSHLRDSGSIEQDADIVLLLHRDRFESETELIIAKNRNGAVGKLQLEFNAERFEFRQSVGEVWQP
jgi:replicative DNA helicase